MVLQRVRPLLKWVGGALAGVLLVGFLLWWFRSQPETAEKAPTVIKYISPRQDPNFQMRVTQPCFVEPYYAINLEAQVPGPIQGLKLAIGDKVKAGERILTLDTPDLKADVEMKEAIVLEREQEKTVAEKMLAVARANLDTAGKALEEKLALQATARADRDFREMETRRFRGLFERGNTTEEVYAERKKLFEAAVAAAQGASAALDKAKADKDGAEAKVSKALADVAYQDELIKVAKEDLGVARAKFGFATLRAPFDGTITRRLVHPGSFVQSSVTGHSEPLLQIERTDIVTVYMNVPDTFVDFLDPNTEAIIELTELPGVRIKGKVSRWSRSLITPAHDHTMRVEVDLWNGTRATLDKFLEDHLYPEAALGRLKDGQGLKGVVGDVAGQARGPDLAACFPAAVWGQSGMANPWQVGWAVAAMNRGFKSFAGVEPSVPVFENQDQSDPSKPPPPYDRLPETYRQNQRLDLLPGMYGTMTLVLRHFPDRLHPGQDAYLIPRSAIYSQGGSPSLYLLAKDDKGRDVAHLRPIDPGFVDDGALALVSLMPKAGQGERSLTGQDRIVSSNQGELEGHEDQPLQASFHGEVRIEEEAWGVDQPFLKAVSWICQGEEKLDKLAREGAGPTVDLGKQMEQVYAKMNKELQDLAGPRKDPLPSGLDQQHQELLDQLSRLHGAAFDLAYAQGMVSMQKRALALFENEARNGQDTGVKAWAEKWLPTLRKHLQLARDAVALFKRER